MVKTLSFDKARLICADDERSLRFLCLLSVTLEVIAAFFPLDWSRSFMMAFTKLRSKSDSVSVRVGAKGKKDDRLTVKGLSNRV